MTAILAMLLTVSLFFNVLLVELTEKGLASNSRKTRFLTKGLSLCYGLALVYTGMACWRAFRAPGGNWLFLGFALLAIWLVVYFAVVLFR